MNNRVLSISYVSANNNEVPSIRLQGKWLEKLGFKHGNKVFVEEAKGEIILRLIDFEEEPKQGFIFLP